MGHLPDLPPELISLITEHLHNDKVALEALSLVCYALLQPCQALIFKRIKLWQAYIYGEGCLTNVAGMVRRILLDQGGAQLLSYTRTLSLSWGQRLVSPYELDDFYDYLLAFKNVRRLKIPLFATHYVRNPLTSPSCYFAHFQPTLRVLHLKTISSNPWDLVTFIAFFPLLEDVTVEMINVSHPYYVLPESEPKGVEPTSPSSFRGTLRLHQFRQAKGFVQELIKYRVQYHTLSFRNVTSRTRIQELIVACAPTLQVLDFACE